MPYKPSLRDEKHRSFLFSRLDLVNRTAPGESVRNADYNMYSTKEHTQLGRAFSQNLLHNYRVTMSEAKINSRRFLSMQFFVFYFVTYT